MAVPGVWSVYTHLLNVAVRNLLRPLKEKEVHGR